MKKKILVFMLGILLLVSSFVIIFININNNKEEELISTVNKIESEPIKPIEPIETVKNENPVVTNFEDSIPVVPLTVKSTSAEETNDVDDVDEMVEVEPEFNITITPDKEVSSTPEPTTTPVPTKTIVKETEVTSTPEPKKETKPTSAPKKTEKKADVKSTPVPTKVPEKVVKPTTTPKATPTPSPVPTKTASKNEVESLSIMGVNVKAAKEFNVKSAWYDSYDGLDELASAIEPQLGETSNGLFIGENAITFSWIAGANAIELIKNESDQSYRLNLNVSLKTNGKEDDVININRSVLQAMLISISPDTTLYSAILDDWEYSEKYGINTESFVKIGNVKVKYVEDGTYIIKKA